MQDNNSSNMLFVTESENGEKLLQFLLHRLHLASTLLHRWIRTGQIRRNGARCTPFERVATKDHIRLPPFALRMVEEKALPKAVETASLPPEIGRYQDWIAYNKPCGLCTHPGSGHTDSLATRLQGAFSDSSFVPVPCHRLDRDTSGVLLVATSYMGLRVMQDALANHTVKKEYLAWVGGMWPHKDLFTLCGHLSKQAWDNREKMVVGALGKEAVTEVVPLIRTAEQSLLLLSIVTGRTHQIRVQLAHAGFPILHDRKYGTNRNAKGNLLLHAYRVILPDGHCFSCVPKWLKPYAVEDALLQIGEQ